MQRRHWLTVAMAWFGAFGCAGDYAAPEAGRSAAVTDPSVIAQELLAKGYRAPEAVHTAASSLPIQAMDAAAGGPEPAEHSTFTPYAVGTVRISIATQSGKPMSVQLWYPAVEAARAEAEAGRPVLAFEPDGPDRQQWADLIRNATPYFTQRTMHAADAPQALATPEALPLVLVSHCTDCLRFGYFIIAERLAAHGFLVASPNHLNSTLYDNIRGTSYGLDVDAGLEQRRLEILALTDTLLDANADSVPADLRGRADPDRIGMLGHSLGAITTAYCSTREPRIRATAFLTMLASLDNRLPYTGDQLAMQQMLKPLSKPAFFLSATEDLMAIIGLPDLIRQNFEHYPAPAWLATLKDAGHYSVSNLCGIVDNMTNGCGPGIRSSELLAPFTYLNIDFAADLTARLVVTFFEQQLLGSSRASYASIQADATSVLTVEEHTP